MEPTPTLAPSVRTYPFARLMFWLAFAHLLVSAGVIHRANHPQVTHTELVLMRAGLLILWPVIVVETWIAFFIRNRAVRPRGSSLARACWITLFPPLRMGMPCPYSGLLWLPGWGWCVRGVELEERLDRAFHKPMLVFAILILPVLVLEYVQREAVQTNHELALALHVSISLIWVAFALEFAIKVSAIRRPFRYSKERWLDLAIVVLPMLEFLLTSLANSAGLARLLRLGRAIAPEQLARMGQIYRLRGLVMKGWRALLVLRIIARLVGRTPEKELRSLEDRIAELEESLTRLRAQAEELRAQVAAAQASNATQSCAVPDAGSG